MQDQRVRAVVPLTLQSCTTLRDRREGTVSESVTVGVDSGYLKDLGARTGRYSIHETRTGRTRARLDPAVHKQRIAVNWVRGCIALEDHKICGLREDIRSALGQRAGGH